MRQTDDTADTVRTHKVWDRTTRWSHWINVACVTGLIGIGVVILNGRALGVSTNGKIALKTLHVYFGYVFCINLLWRLIWAFFGNRYARWRAILPYGVGYLKQLKAWGAGLLGTGKGRPYLGHNPAGRIMVLAMLTLLSAQAVTGLVLAGTDVYMLPFGHQFKAWVAESGVAMAEITPGSKNHINEDAYQSMRSFRKPFIAVHYYAFYILLVAILLHIVAVIVAELRQGSSLVSAMITGGKHIRGTPVDADA
jgi:cytochrome b